MQKLDNGNLNIMSLCQISSINKDLRNYYVHFTTGRYISIKYFSFLKKLQNIFLTAKEQRTIDLSTKARAEPVPDADADNATSL